MVFANSQWYSQTRSGIGKLGVVFGNCKVAFESWELYAKTGSCIRKLGPSRRNHALYSPEGVAVCIPQEDKLNFKTQSIYCAQRVAVLIP